MNKIDVNIVFNSKKAALFLRSLLVFLLFWNSTFLQLILAKLLHINIETITKTTSVLLSTLSNIILIIIFYFIYRKDLKKEFKIFRKNTMECLDIGVRWWFIGLMIMIVSNLIITFFLKGGGANNEKTVQTYLKVVPSLMFLNTSFLAPFNEEIAFRKTLKDIIKSKWLLAFCSFLLFGGAHVFTNIRDLANIYNNITDALYIIPYGALGGAFALAYYESDTIFTPMFFHMFHNTCLVLLSIFAL